MIIKKLLRLALLLLLVTVNAQTNFYVDARKGNDSNTGTSWAASFKTLNKALQQVRTPATGTINVYVATGSYTVPETNVLGDNAKISVIGGYPSGGGTPNVVEFPVYVTQTFNGSMFVTNGSSAELLLRNMTILYSQGTVIRPGLMYFEGSSNNVFTMDHVNIKDYSAGDVGMIFPFNSTNTKINILNSFIENSTSRGRGGSFVFTSQLNSSRNVDVNISNTVFRNIKMRFNAGTARYQSIIEMDMVCNVDNGESEVTIDNSKFYYIDGVRVNRASGGRAPVVDVNRIGKLTITNSQFKGNDGQAGVISFRNSGELLSQNNIFHNNTAAYSGGAYQIIGDYDCGANPAAVNAIPLKFINDQYYANRAGMMNLIGGRGGAIYIAAGEAGDTGTSRRVQIQDSKFVKNQTGAYGGGAVYATTSAAITVTGTEFTCNQAGVLNTVTRIDLGGGAMEVKGTGTLTVTNSTFNRNNSEGYGGAIASNLAMTISGSSFQSNESLAAGGAIRTLDTGTQTITNTTFNYNKASQGGAIANGTGVLPMGTMTVNGSVFYGNISTDTGAENGGGAVYNNVYNYTSNNNKYYLNTTTASGGAIFNAILVNPATLTVSGDTFYQNKALNEFGGAIYYSGIGAGNFDLSGSTFYQNQANRGGAIAINAGVNGTVKLNTSNFLQNAATTEGGALAVYDAGQIGDEVDQMDGSKFFGNTVAGSATNTSQDGRSDIYIGNVTNLYYSNIRNITNTALQFGNDTNVYDTTLGSVGFHLGTNVTLATAASITAPAAMAAPAQVLECALVTVPDYSIIPQVLGGKDGVNGEFNIYTEITPSAACTFSNVYVKFNAWSTQTAPFATTPLPGDVTFTYRVFRVNKLTNAVTDLGTRTADASAVLVRDEYVAESGDAYRYQYLTYYVDVTSLMEQNSDFHFIVTNVKDNTTGISTSYSLTDGVEATISTLECPVCYNPVTNTTPGIPVKHGITLLKRAGADNGNWPMNRNSAHTALESNTKGFVITRVATTAALGGITNPVEGMMVYDGEAKCLKIYVVDNTTPANTGWKCFSSPACP